MQVERIERYQNKLYVYYKDKLGKENIKEVGLTPRLNTLFQIGEREILIREVMNDVRCK